MKLYIIAGEASGDLHGKNLVAALKAQREGLHFRGVGGDGMAAEGVSLVQHIRNTNFMGFVQVVRNLGKIRQLFKDVKADVFAYQPDAVILIDYPGFNLRIAKFLHERGIKVFFYISPQVWAWKKSRVKKIRRYVDRMFVILPFEKDFYAKEGYEVDFVGHPLLDEIRFGGYDGEKIRQTHLKGRSKLVAILPGSRKQEISRMLPRMLSIADRFPDVRFVVGGAPTQQLEFYSSLLDDPEIPVVMAQTYELLSAADAALVTSGTATLETALFRVPEVVCYAGPWLSVQLARWLIRVDFISLVNLVMEREVVKELIQKELNADNLYTELNALLNDAAKKQQFEADYDELHKRLGDAGASARTAKLMLGYLV